MSAASQLDAMEGLWRALDLPLSALDRLAFRRDDELPSLLQVSDLAAGAVGAATLAVSELIGIEGGAPGVDVDRRLSSIWFGWSIKPIGWQMPAPWDPIAGDYRTRDGWIRLHTNAPRHRAAAIGVLGCAEDREAVAAAVAKRRANALETAVVAAGGCAAAMHSFKTWLGHRQGGPVQVEPLIAMRPIGVRANWKWRPAPTRPLAGIRVLDLTRVLAGPVATRFLAGYGADVLRVDPPDWDEAVIPEVTLGKRCTRLDLTIAEGRSVFEKLLSEAHVLVHGYRTGALEALGYGEAARQTIAPHLIDVSLNAYGWRGPWRERRGFDSLVQMSSGIADGGMEWLGADRPTPLPVQALDHATGYLMAATVVRGLIGRLRTGRPLRGRLSLARTAAQLIRMGRSDPASPWVAAGDADFAPEGESTDWGPALRAKPPAVVANAPMRWGRSASRLGSSPPNWA